MIQVKLFTNRTEVVERNVNEWLTKMQTVPNKVFELKDIKLRYSRGNDMNRVLITYDQRGKVDDSSFNLPDEPIPPTGHYRS